MGNRAGKGSAFERELCKALSLWYSGGSRDDLYWRTAGSGGRATNRGRRGKATAGSYGDICTTCPEGKPLLDVLTFEVKRGYNRATVQDLLDKPEKAATQEYEDWILQATESSRLAESRSWAVVFRRDKRRTLVMLPEPMWARLAAGGPYQMIRAQVEVKGSAFWRWVVVVLLDDFFLAVDPECVRALVREG